MDGESPQRDAERFAYVTLVTSDGYVDGALVLLHSLRRTLTPHSVLCLVTPSALSSGSLQRLHQHFDGVIETDLQQSTDDRNLALLGRPDLRSTLTKIQLWHPALFGAWSAICYLDADTLVRQPIDDIFSRFYAWRADEPGWRRGGLAAAAPDTGWPDCFNSGVLLLAPGLECYQGLIRRASQSNASFDGADQGLLNEHFADWATARPYRRLPFLYNATANVYYTYEPALQRFGHDVRVVHFIGISKPWHWERTPGGQLQSNASTSERWRQLVSLWWNIHDEHVSGWNYWRGPFDKNVAFGEGYHHITEPVGQPEPHSGHGGDSHLSDSQPHLAGGQVPEVADWEKDWTWAVDRVHPLDYAYLVPRTKATPEPDPSESAQQSYPTQRPHVKQHHEHAQPRHLQPARDYPSEAVHSAAAQRDAPNWAADMHYDNANGSQLQSIEQSCPESPCQRQEDERKPVSAPPAWMHSGRPWEDVAREGWMHHGDYKPHVYDQAYIQRHVDTPYPVEPHGQSQPAAQYHQQQEPHRDHYWQPEYTPMSLPHNQPIYEAAQVVLQPHVDDHKGHHDRQYPSENTAGQHWERDHHDISYRPPREHHDASHNQNHSDHEIMYAPAPAYPFQHHCNYKHDQPYHEHGGEQPYQPAPVDRHDGQSTSSGSPLYYPQPKSPMVVNPVALWESSEEQARRRAWAQRVQEPINEAGSGTHLQHNTPWAAPAPAADQRIPPSSMDHIDSSQLPQETPWKVSHVRHRPAGGMAANGNPQSPHLGMQFKEGVANDSNARDAAGQLLKRWNEAVIARNIQSKFGDIDPDHISHSVAAPEKGIDAIRLETTVSCEAEDSKGERTVYRFTLSSTLDIGGAKGAPAAMAPASIPSQQTINADSASKPAQNKGHLDNPPAAYHTEPLALDGRVPDAIDIDDGGSEGVARDYANATSLRQPENYHEPAISRRSSFVQLQRNATRAPHMALRSGYDNDDQFAESDARI
ncbi:glycogenin glucosyltransferase [Coemansia sp. Cherry 401B]|nr:glycogenin glucosyltransferase [Coemansia sp. Cherry 401B]